MVKIKLKVGAGEAKSGPPLAPILGQHQVNLVEFCKLFNAKSLDLYSQGTPCTLKIYKKQGVALKYLYRPLSFYNLVINFCLYYNKSRFITYSQLYDIYTIRVLNLKKLDQPTNLKSIAKELFGFINSSKIELKK